jgi:hypothetical protein
MVKVDELIQFGNPFFRNNIPEKMVKQITYSKNPKLPLKSNHIL